LGIHYSTPKHWKYYNPTLIRIFSSKWLWLSLLFDKGQDVNDMEDLAQEAAVATNEEVIHPYIDDEENREGVERNRGGEARLAQGTVASRKKGANSASSSSSSRSPSAGSPHLGDPSFGVANASSSSSSSSSVPSGISSSFKSLDGQEDLISF
jgi:hypothetical protein